MTRAMLGDYVKECRRIHGLSLRDMEAKTGVSASQISKIERGISNPTQETLDQLAYALNVDRYELYVMAGILNEEIKQEIAYYLPDVFGLDGDKNLMASESPARYIIREETLKEGVAALLNKHDPGMSENEAAFVCKEMVAAYELSKKRLRNQN